MTYLSLKTVEDVADAITEIPNPRDGRALNQRTTLTFNRTQEVTVAHYYGIIGIEDAAPDRMEAPITFSQRTENILEILLKMEKSIEII